MSSTQLTRREILHLGAGVVVASALEWPRLLAEQVPAKRIPIGLQLYSVREDCQKDLPRVLEAVAKMGYEGVEFAGYYGRSAKELRKLLDQNGLRCCGTHTGLNTLQGDALLTYPQFLASRRRASSKAVRACEDVSCNRPIIFRPMKNRPQAPG